MADAPDVAAGRQDPLGEPSGWLERLPAWGIGLGLVALALVLYWLPGSDRFYNHFVWQADAFLHGRAVIDWPVQPFDDNPGNGYYAPDDYRRYALTGFSYIGISEDVGLSLQAGLGRQRDETFDSWRRANDFNAQLVFGILSPWQFSINAGYSERVQNTGAYEGHTWGVTLTHRF